jgi:hypothetical protein
MTEALGRQWGGTLAHHLVTKSMAKAINRGQVRHMAGLRGINESLSQQAHDQPYAPGDLSKGMGYATSRIKPGATVRLRGEEEEAGDEDITARRGFWLPEGTHELEIHHPRAVSKFESAGFESGPEHARKLDTPKLKSWGNDNEFYHHTSDAAARDIVHRLSSGQPGLLLSRGGDTGPGIYTSADRTAWSNMGHRRDHPGWEFALHLRGHQSIGSGPGGAGMYDRDPHPRAARRYYNLGREGRSSWQPHARGVDPNFWREHGIDTVVTGGKETVVTHPLQVQVLRATDKSTGRTHHFQDEVHRHYKPELRVGESDYSPRQERK